MSYGFVLFDDRLVGLAVLVASRGVAALVKEELGKVEVLLLSRHCIEFGQCHFGYLMSGYIDLLAFAFTYFIIDTVGITDGYVEKVSLAGCLVMGNGAFDHVAQIVEFVAEVFHLDPTLVACPLVGSGRILCTRGIEVTVRLLGRCYDDKHTVDVSFQFFVGVSLQQVAGSFDGFIDISIVEGVTTNLHTFGYFSILGGVFQGRILLQLHHQGRTGEILVASSLLALAEGEGDGHFATGFETLPPEIVGYLHTGEGYGVDGITSGSGGFGLCDGRRCRPCKAQCGGQK